MLSYTPLSIGSMKKPCTQAMTVTKIAMRCTMTSQKWRYCSRRALPVSSGSPIHGARSGVLFRIAVLDQRFGVVFDVTGELISQIVRLVSRQAADLREHAVAIFLSVHSLTLFYAKCSTAFTAPLYSCQAFSSSVSAARPARVR